ncbi:MAG: hypothetical protein LLF94_09740 [Chlamydiales bacterium]|nr:hypothetical protein [Chlamydiales bacterium]
MQQLRSLFSIDTGRGVLTAYDGTEYKKIEATDFEQKLVLELQDPAFACLINVSYQRYIRPLLSEGEAALFEKSILETVLVFGSYTYSPRQVLEKTLQANGFDVQEWVNHHQDAFLSFFRDTACLKPNKERSASPRVTLLHTTASGGNSAVARALQAFLESRGAVCQSIDVETIACKHDAMKKATGYTYDGIYAEFFQKKNIAAKDEGLPLILEDRVALNRQIAEYIAPCTQKELKAKIAEFAPTLIISTRSYTSEDINLAYTFDVPMKFVYCDYDIFLAGTYLGKTNPHLFQFWMPKLNARTFSFALSTLDKKTEHSPYDSWQTVAKRISQVVQSPLEEITSTFCEIGYPVGPEYVRITDPQKLSELRKKWDLKPGEHLVLVTMGKNGVGIIKEIFKTLAESPTQELHIKYVFICGSNEELFRELSTYAQKHDLSNTELKRMQICGFISHQEMSELMNICSLKCSKPGGGAAAQCRAMNVPLFSMYAHKLWENGNERELSDAGLNYPYDPGQELIPQIEKAITYANLSRNIPPVTDWKARVAQNLC